MDCNGHGSHVAGTVGGAGVNADGSTFQGPWDGSVPFTSLRIGPGVAPKASLYALRVFGCSGSTGLVTQALEWAMDPNRDGDFSDSWTSSTCLSARVRESDDSSAIASDNAARAGIVVVCSAGNSGDTYFVNSSPGTSNYAISVAASVDSGITAGSLRVLEPSSVASVVRAGTADFGGAASGRTDAGSPGPAPPAKACAAISNGSALRARSRSSTGDVQLRRRRSKRPDAGRSPSSSPTTPGDPGMCRNRRRVRDDPSVLDLPLRRKPA
ncbi:MAG: S8 family serine peptidase [Holophagales bacterium]|nr:S8 family serine peptidase [Holophagales bacterium]